MRKVLDVVLVGIGGYGANYVKKMAELDAAGKARVCAVVDPFGEQSPDWPALAARGVPRFDTYDQFLAAGLRAELAAIASPIAFHAAQSCAALNAGADVLCEKPLCATIQDAQVMIAARDAARRMLSIGYQWSFSEAVQRLKADVLAGLFGAPCELRTWLSWPRGKAYYARNNWAGRLRDAQGRWVLDSPVNNATAHYLHNMLYLLGPATDRSATPLAITAECYRANPTENFDAACCRIETREGAPVMFFSAHCVDVQRNPVCSYRFEQAVISYNDKTEFVARFHDGREINYGSPGLEVMRKLALCVDWTLEGSTGTTPCGVEAAMMHTLCVNGLQETPIHPFDPALIRRQSWNDGDELTFVEGLDAAMRQGFEQGALFSELSLPWAAPAQRVDLADYKSFPRA